MSMALTGSLMESHRQGNLDCQGGVSMTGTHAYVRIRVQLEC